MNDLIEKLSNLRSRFNCFDENERDAYHTLSEAIKVLSERPEPCEDTVSRQKAIDAVSDGIIMEEEPLVECVGECNAMIEWAVETLKKLPSAQPEPCEDAVSRRILLNDLKELITAWKKYPVMAEQIKGVETAIKYVEMIPSVTPKRKTGRWIEEQRGIKVTQYKCSECGRTVMDDTGYDVTKDYPFCHCGADMRCEQNE